MGKANLRNLHSWAALISALPVGVMVVTGFFLLLRSHLPWIQPPTLKGRASGGTLSFERVLAAASRAPDAGIRSWGDVSKVELSPKAGVVKVRTRDGWEVQLDSHTGDVLTVARRRQGWLIQLHEGSLFGKPVLYLVFLPATLMLFFLWVSGLVLFFQRRRLWTIRDFASVSRRSSFWRRRGVYAPSGTGT